MKLKKDLDKEKVLDCIKQWISAYETRDLNAFRTVLSGSESHISWGTGVDERYDGINHFLACVQRDFKQSEGAALKPLSTYIVIHDLCAWVAAEIEPTVNINGISQKFEVLRTTIVLSKNGEKWRIEHTHASWPYPDQDKGQSFPKID